MPTIEMPNNGDYDRIKKWCMEQFGPENPNVWTTLEPGWGVLKTPYAGKLFVRITNKKQQEMFMLTWGF